MSLKDSDRIKEHEKKEQFARTVTIGTVVILFAASSLWFLYGGTQDDVPLSKHNHVPTSSVKCDRDVCIGDTWVWQIGNPFREQNTLTFDIIDLRDGWVQYKYSGNTFECKVPDFKDGSCIRENGHMAVLYSNIPNNPTKVIKHR